MNEFQICNEKEGYVVRMWSDLNTPNIHHWHKLINFGDFQGDAILFIQKKIEEYDTKFLIKMIMAYNPDDKYSYQNDGTGIFKLKKQNKWYRY